MLYPTDTLRPSETLYPSDLPMIADILIAFREALIADATFLTLVPAANVYAGLRDEKTPIPAVDIFMIPGAEPERYAGSAIGGMTLIHAAFQISVFHRTDAGAQIITGRIMSILLGDNTTLNTAKIKNVSLMNMPPSLPDVAGVHIPLRVRYDYHITTV